MRSGFVLVVVLVAACRFTPGTGDNGTIDAGIRDSLITSAIDAVVDGRVDAPSNVMCDPAYAVSFSGHSYRKTPTAGFRADAKANCASDGGHLIKIETGAEDMFAFGQFPTGSSTYFWIGLTFVSPSWSWDDGAPLGTGYQKFMGGSVPTTPGSSTCVDASPNFLNWNAFPCSQTPHQGLCECDGS